VIDKEILEKRILEATKEYARQSLEYSLKGQTVGAEFGQLGLKLGFYANGGAILAVLSLIGSKNYSGLPINTFVSPFLLYIFGLLSIFVSTFFAYLNFNFHSILRSDPSALCNTILEGSPNDWPYDYKARSKIQWSLYLAGGFAILSFVMFLGGSLILVKSENCCKFASARLMTA